MGAHRVQTQNRYNLHSIFTKKKEQIGFMGRGQNINETACRSKNIVNICPGSRKQKNNCRNIIMSWWTLYYPPTWRLLTGETKVLTGEASSRGMLEPTKYTELLIEESHIHYTHTCRKGTQIGTDQTKPDQSWRNCISDRTLDRRQSCWEFGGRLSWLAADYYDKR